MGGGGRGEVFEMKNLHNTLHSVHEKLDGDVVFHDTLEYSRTTLQCFFLTVQVLSQTQRGELFLSPRRT